MLHDPERILITGYNGFVAPHLIAACRQRYPSAELFGLLHTVSQPPIADAQTTPATQVNVARVTVLEGDVTDGAKLRQIHHDIQPNLIFHLAALSSVAASWKDPANVLRVNAGGFIHLVEAVRPECPSARIVVVGSGEQYGLVGPEENPLTEETLPRPVNPYAVSKVAQDLFAFQYHKAYGLDIIRARPFNHFGPGQSADFVIASFARQIAEIEMGQNPPTMEVGNLSAQRDFLSVGDVVQAYIALADKGQAGAAYNIGSGSARSIESVLQMLLAMAAVQVEIRIDPERFRPVEVPVLCANTTKIQSDTGWFPTDALDEALRATLEYWRHITKSSSS